MKVRVLVVTLFILAATVAAAQPASVEAAATPVTSDGAALNAKELEALSSAVTMLQKSFAVDKEGNKRESTQDQSTTMAEVADKVVNLGARAIAQAADSIEKVAPRVWSVMVRQQYAKAIGDLTVPFVGFLITLIIFIRTKAYRIRCWDNVDRASTEEYLFAVAIVVALMITSLWVAYALSNSVMYLINPEFYAFRDLLVMILNKGQGM